MQQLEQAEIQALLSRLPKIEPSYERTDTAAPANYDFRVSISIGKKYYVWIQYDESGDAVFFMELNKEKKVSIVNRFSLGEGCTMLPFSKGTAMYGTMCEHTTSGRNVFLIEDVYYYCGLNVAKETFFRKLPRMAQIVEKMGSVFPIWMRLPHITDISRQECQRPSLPGWSGVCQKPGYIEHHAQYRSGDKLAPYVNLVKDQAGVLETVMPIMPVCERPLMCDYSRPQFKEPTVFWVKPAVQFDIYNLFCQRPPDLCDRICENKTHKRTYCGVAGIQTYKTSVLLNTVFRKIRANQNLDAIEESDDDEDFEDVRESKWVLDMEKEVKMVCEFNAKVRKWIPVKLADEDASVITADKLRNTQIK